ncbi:uncharacterized protein LOC129302617 [Prosopis cineraria]|uniref:uncharacterized protein LOC129302617 n=1 Tax=Prosopis cineraria TaxID=364024 RepID=UPI00240EDEAA|nr:uncharacterized protein LOC129302617 [Prosopis cineraria]
MGFSEHVQVEHIVHAELLAIKKGLELAWDLECHKVICETDSTESLGLIEWANVDIHMYREVIKEIREICKREWGSLQFVHVFREGNQCADFLAKFGSKNQYNCTWNNPLPVALQTQLENDAMGTFYFRSKL